MKRILFSLAAFCWTIASFACTNLIVGRKASADGSVICSYNCDGFGFASGMNFLPAGRHAAGEMLTLRNGKQIPQVEYTYKVTGLMNEKQVTIVETTWDGRQELVNRDGYFDYFALMQTALQRSANAREAIAVIDHLVQTYGYNATGENFVIADPQEAWIFEIIGMGEGRTGANWVARRVPDDCICAYANVSRIRQFPQAKKIDKKLGFYVAEDCMYSAECISFAREKGYFSGKDEDFSWREAYCPIDFTEVRACDARVWSFFRHHYDTEVMDSYLPYLDGHFDVCDALPLWIKPDTKLSVRDVMNDMRDHYEGTALDMTADVSAGPWASPYRNQPLNYTASDGTEMFRERPIGCQQSAMTMVCQMRDWLPDAFGGVSYFNMDDASMVAYVPAYCGISRIPDPFRDENTSMTEFSTESAFWMNNFVANMVYPRYSAMIGDLKAAQKELEDYYEQEQKELETRIAGMTPNAMEDLLTAKTEEYVGRMMTRWGELAKLLIVKYNDQTINRRMAAPGQGAPAYSPVFIDAVKEKTGDRYVKPLNKAMADR